MSKFAKAFEHEQYGTMLVYFDPFGDEGAPSLVHKMWGPDGTSLQFHVHFKDDAEGEEHALTALAEKYESADSVVSVFEAIVGSALDDVFTEDSDDSEDSGH